MHTQAGDIRTRWATEDDLPALKALMGLAIDTLQSTVLTPEQVVASHGLMGLDTQLVADRTYLVAEIGGQIAGCGGWSYRATLYGGDHSTDLRNPETLDPSRDAAKIRAMYTHPDFTRRGVGRRVLKTCEEAASKAGFSSVELMGTLSGLPLYTACGYRPVEEVNARSGDVVIPFVRMRKTL